MDQILKKQGFPDMGEITMEQVWDVFNQLNPMEKKSLSSALEVLVEHSSGKPSEGNGDTDTDKTVSDREEGAAEADLEGDDHGDTDLSGPDRDSPMHSSSHNDGSLGKTIIIHDDQLEKTFSMVKLEDNDSQFSRDPNTLHIPFTAEQLSETSNLMKWVGATDMRTFLWEYEAIIRAIFAAWNCDEDVENLEFYLVYYLPFFVSLGVIYSLEAEFGYRDIVVQGLSECSIEEDMVAQHQRVLAGSWREIRRYAVKEFAAIKSDDEFNLHTMALVQNVAVSKRGGLKRYLSYIARLVSRAESEREINKCLYGDAGEGGQLETSEVFSIVLLRLPFKWRIAAANLAGKSTSAVEFATILEHTFSKDQDFNAHNEELMGGSLFEKNRRKTKKKRDTDKEQSSTDAADRGSQETAAAPKRAKSVVEMALAGDASSKEQLKEKQAALIQALRRAFELSPDAKCDSDWAWVKNMKLDVVDTVPPAPAERKRGVLDSLRGT